MYNICIIHVYMYIYNYMYMFIYIYIYTHIRVWRVGDQVAALIRLLVQRA